ncbi:reverse transcriptase [Plakobranchus ocellatus]|uniref:Reverse transcriptase n=1 Tax=Plakobranchus ocellatus TaxID=259542 RepID=A0AAV3YC32_9GAST|nr:reverse transcriptase [Plakobranchus ocellatus]
MAPLRISFLIRSVYDLLPSNANLVRWGKKDDPTCPLCQGRQTTEHVLSSCKVALSQGRYTWRHKRVLQELASVISTAKGKSTPLQQAQQYSPQKVESKNGTEGRSQ